MSECTFRTIYRSVTGVAYVCEGCGTLNIGFGNVLMTMHTDELVYFSTAIRHALKQHRTAPAPAHVKCITIPTPGTGISLIFTPAELTSLDDFLDRVSSRLQIQELAMSCRNKDQHLN